MSSHSTPTPNPALQRLEALIGRWNIDITLPTDPPIRVSARAVFEWMEGGFFVVHRSEADAPEFPKGMSIIGADDSTDAYSMLYSDSRGVFRLYEMSLRDGVWKLWRTAPQFSQRFEGTFSEDGRTITAYWQLSRDDAAWQHDFDLVYTKVE